MARWMTRVFLWSSGLLLVLSSLLLVAPAGWVESAWMTGAWPVWPALTARLHTLVPVPLTLPLLALVTLGLLGWALRRRPRWRRSLLTLLAWAALLALAFVPAWGAAYRRAPLAETLGLPSAGADTAMLLDALERLVARVQADAPPQALAALDDVTGLEAAVAAAGRCVQATDAAVSGRSLAVPQRVRALPAGALLRSGYAGISLPWLLEPHVDAALPPAAYLSVATHELTHAAGWAREADTDALSLLAGLGCDHAWVRYASALHGVQVVVVSLRPLLDEQGPERARLEASMAALPSAAQADRAALAHAVRRWHDPTLARVVTTVYDGYLRSQGVAAGVADYDAAGALLGAALAVCEQDPGAAPRWCP